MTVELPSSLASGRFQIQERPATAPGNCSVCGSVERPVMFFGTHIDYYGTILICVECIVSAYSLFLAVGMIEDEAGTRVVSLMDNEGYLDAGTINEYVRTATDSVNSLNSILSRIRPVAVPTEAVHDEPSEPAQGVISADDALSESVSEPGPDDVPSSTSRDAVFDL